MIDEIRKPDCPDYQCGKNMGSSELLKTHTCAAVQGLKPGEQVTLGGWLQAFQNEQPPAILLRDQSGVVRVVLEDQKLADRMLQVEVESVLQIVGIVRSGLSTDEVIISHKLNVEVLAQEFQILSAAKPLPFPVDSDEATDEHQEQAYRYLVLRRPQFHRNLTAVSEVRRVIRYSLIDRGFIEVDNLRQEYQDSFGVELNGEYLTPSRLSLTPLLGTLSTNMKKCYQFVHAPVNPRIPLPFGIEGSWLHLGVANCGSITEIFTLMEDLLQDLAQSHECEARVKSILPSPSLCTFSQTKKRRETLRFDVMGAVKCMDSEDTLCMMCFHFPRELDLLSEEADWFFESLRVYQVEHASWLIVRGPDQVDMKQCGTFAAISPESIALDTSSDFLKLIQPSSKFDLLLLTVPCGSLNDLHEELEIQMQLRLDIDNRILEFNWLGEEPLFEKIQGRLTMRYHAFVSSLQTDQDLLVTSPEKVRGEIFPLMYERQKLGYAYVRNRDFTAQKLLFRLLQWGDEEISKLAPVLLDAFEYNIAFCGLELQIERLAAILTGEYDITKMVSFP